MGKQDNHRTKSRIRKYIRQGGERARQSNLRSSREQVVYFYFLIIFILVSIYLDRNSALPYLSECVPANTGWVAETGEAVSLSELPAGILDLSKDVSDQSFHGESLCLKSVDTLFDVWMDNVFTVIIQQYPGGLALPMVCMFIPFRFPKIQIL